MVKYFLIAICLIRRKLIARNIISKKTKNKKRIV